MKSILKYLAVCLFAAVLAGACTAEPATPNPVSPEPTVTPLVQAAPPCNAITIAPTPAADEPSLIPPVGKDDHIRGGVDNPSVTIIVYGDLQDATSALFAGVMQRILAEHPNEVRFVSRIFPLVGRNDKALLAAQAVEAAHLQGKFWEMHDLLYAQQKNWVNLSPEDFAQWSAAQASALGMNVEQYQADVKSEAVTTLVQNRFEAARQFGPFAVPLILINGEIYLGPQDYSSINDIIQLILLGRRQFTECPPLVVEKTKQYLATLYTEKGEVALQLFADKAPYTVNSFVFLARSGWYDNITFHRVIADLYVQSGDPSGTGKGQPGYYVMTEILPDLRFDAPGKVAMVNSGPDTSGSQFFITLAPAPQFDGKYTIFGEVLSGMDVLRALTPRNAQPGVETPPGDKLLHIEIEEK